MFEDGNWLCLVGLVLIPLAMLMRSRFGGNASQDFSQPPYGQPPYGQPPYAPRPRPIRPEHQRTQQLDIYAAVVGAILGVLIILLMMIQTGR